MSGERYEVSQAMLTYLRRKEEAGIEAKKPKRAAAEEVSLVMSGFDLNQEELTALSPTVVNSLAKGLEAGIDVPTVLFSGWLDGLMVGLILAEERGQVDDEVLEAAARLREAVPPDEPQPSDDEAGRNRRKHKSDLLLVLDAIVALGGER